MDNDCSTALLRYTILSFFLSWYLNRILTDYKSEVPRERSPIIPYYNMSTETIDSG